MDQAKSPNSVAMDEASAPYRQIFPRVGGVTVPKYTTNADAVWPLFGLNGRQYGRVSPANRWQIEAAIETASVSQRNLFMVPLQTRIQCVRGVTEHFLSKETDFEALGWLSGTDISDLNRQIQGLRDWGKSLDEFVKRAFPESGPSASWRPSSPVFFLLPSNSEIEICSLIFQALLGGNSVVVRPSRRGGSAYGLSLAIEAWDECVDRLCSIDDARRLKAAVSIIPTTTGIPWAQLAVDGWNYVLFGANETLNAVEAEITSRVGPRRVIKYGTGLSTAIVADDADLDIATREILESSSHRAGNDCLGTDIAYVQQAIAEQFFAQLSQLSSRYCSLPPDSGHGCGLVTPQNVEAVVSQLDILGKARFLRLGQFNGLTCIHPSVIRLEDHESAIEYPAPILSVRAYLDNQHLSSQIKKDLLYNEQSRNLSTSIFTRSDDVWIKLQSVSRAWLCRRNRSSHEIDPLVPHQGVYLGRELSDPYFLDP